MSPRSSNAARQRTRDLEAENKILRKAAAAVEEVVRPKEQFRLVAELHGDGVRVRQACCALGVSPSGYYDWKSRAPSARPVRHAWLTGLIGQVHDASYGTYCQLRVDAELQRNHRAGGRRNTVMLPVRRARLSGLSWLPLRRRAKRVPSQKTVTDLVKRQFTAYGPNRLWVTDTTEHPTREGKVYCCVVTACSAAALLAGPSTPPGALTWPPVPWGWRSTRAVPHPAQSFTAITEPRQFTSCAFTTRAENAGPAVLARHRRRSLRLRASSYRCRGGLTLAHDRPCGALALT